MMATPMIFATVVLFGISLVVNPGVVVINNDHALVAGWAKSRDEITNCGLGDVAFGRYLMWRTKGLPVLRVKYVRMTMTGKPEECIAYAAVYYLK